MSPRYIVITPVRNEAPRLLRAIASMVAQTVRPAQWILVDDGSTDDTAGLVAAAAGEQPWITLVRRSDRGFRQPGTGVIAAFYDGFSRVGPSDWEYLVKLDGDLEFASDYFEKCLQQFGRDPKLGIGGGQVCSLVDGVPVVEVKNDPAFHVRGATKIYRRECWDQISPLLQSPGWDTIDEVKANMHGWTTRTFPGIQIVQLKPTGSADGKWRDWFKNGRANYVTGYHFLFMVCKCAQRAFRRPYLLAGVALLCGYVSGYFLGIPQVEDRAMIRYLRAQQMNRLLLRPSLWG